jgi:D-alanyl-D-alanine carboxypeptidase/D-alanyl-D-alanine-endopeptidase (penicillin-binding protein 4)
MFEMQPAEVDSYLSKLQSAESDFGKRVLKIARDSLDTPYAGGPLGEGPEGKYDKDPLMDLSKVDCVTFVEQTLSLAASTSHNDTSERLQRIRYHNGRIAFEDRNHFMISDWIKHNTFCEDVSGKLGIQTEQVTRTIGRRKLFASAGAADLAAAAQDTSETLDYVPMAKLTEAEKALSSPSLIVLVGKVDWLFALHVGFFIRDEDGTGRFYNASSTVNKVVATPFSELAASKRYIGFTAYRLTSPK